MSNNNDKYELDYYLSIIDFFQNQNTNRETTEIWKNKSLIELMRVLERTHKKEFVKNAILFIFSLFDENQPDIYNCRGSNVDSLDNGEKRPYISILKTEFTDDILN